MTRARVSATLEALLTEALPDHPRIRHRRMFGCPCAFVEGSMFAGIHRGDVFVRLPERDRELLGSEFGARGFEPMPGRRMREYVVLPAAVVDDGEELGAWLQRAMHFAASLPRKKQPRRPAPPGASSRPASVTRRRQAR